MRHDINMKSPLGPAVHQLCMHINGSHKHTPCALRAQSVALCCLAHFQARVRSSALSFNGSMSNSKGVHASTRTSYWDNLSVLVLFDTSHQQDVARHHQLGYGDSPIRCNNKNMSLHTAMTVADTD